MRKVEGTHDLSYISGVSLAPCVYLISCSRDSRVYVGASTNFPARRNKHVCDLRKGAHPNEALQGVWNRRGEETFRFFPIEDCTADTLDATEQYWLDHYAGRRFNVGQFTNPMKGVPLGAAQRKKISDLTRGIENTQEHNERISRARRPNPHNLKHLVSGVKIAVANMRKWCRENKLNRRHIMSVLAGDRHSHLGWARA